MTLFNYSDSIAYPQTTQALSAANAGVWDMSPTRSHL